VGANESRLICGAPNDIPNDLMPYVTQVAKGKLERGTSVLELIKAFEKANGIEVLYEIVNRRPGDITSYYANALKAKQELGWTAKRDITAMRGMLGGLRRIL